MAAIVGRTELGIREFGNTVTVPADPKARLMYYLNCICTVLDLSDQQNLSRLRDFNKYYLLSEAETDALIALTFLLSPDELSNKVIFEDDDMCGNTKNTFFEVSAVRSNLLVSDSIIIGGQQRHVNKIMAYKRQWLVDNWQVPMLSFSSRLVALASEPAAPQRPAIEYQAPSREYRTPQRSTYSNNSNSSDGCCCTIL